MCAIIGSFNKDKLRELIELNSYRGNHSYSLSEYNPIMGNLKIIERNLGEFKFNLLSKLSKDLYYIAHIQAPTTEDKNFGNIHPHKHLNSLLWHNGIIKEDFIKIMQDKLDISIQEKWDTALLNKWIYYNHSLSEVDGTFSCLKYDGVNLYLFRNQISPLFIDEYWNISSTKFDNSQSTKPNKVLLMDFKNKKLKGLKNFKTKNNPYFF